MIKFTIEGDIPSMKNTLRVNRRGGVYHADNGVNTYKEAFCCLCPKSAKKCLLGPLGVVLRIYKKDNRKDGCNMSGMVYDAMQYAGVIKNDRNLVERHEFDYIDKKNPRVEIRVWARDATK